MESPLSTLLDTPLGTRVVGRAAEVFDEIDSTNDYALQHGTDGLVVVADSQNAGRGRMGRSWHSAPGLGLWFTVALEGLIDGVVFAAALAVRDAIAPHAPAKVKWPNDILINGHKVCGILAEHRDGITALGIGVNVHHTREDFPKELLAKAGSLTTESDHPWDRVTLLRDILKHLDQKVILLRNGEFEHVRDEWAEACELRGRRIRCDAIEGVVNDIDAKGALLVETADGLERILSGDLMLLDGDR